MAQVIFSLQALDHLERFREPDAVAGAKAVLRILGCIEVLRDHPEIGRPVRLRRRELVISRGKTGYLALYDYDPLRELVRVLCIRHQREAGYTP